MLFVLSFDFFQAKFGRLLPFRQPLVTFFIQLRRRDFSKGIKLREEQHAKRDQSRNPDRVPESLLPRER